MSFKKNNPGCPCDCGGGGGGPCGCDATQVKIDISNADDLIQIFGTRASPGPCNFLDFYGFSIADGTYYVTWPSVPSTILLGQWQSTTGKIIDGFFAYCCYLKIELIASSGSLPCNAFLRFTIHLETLFDTSDPCPDVEDIIWTSNYQDEFFPGISLCITDDDSISIQTVVGINASDCGAKYWTCDVDVSPSP